MCEAKKFLPALFNKTQKLYTFILHPLANIITDEFKTKGSLFFNFYRCNVHLEESLSITHQRIVLPSLLKY